MALCLQTRAVPATLHGITLAWTAQLALGPALLPARPPRTALSLHCRATVAPLPGIPGGVPAGSGLTTLQVVVAEAAAMRLAGDPPAAHCRTPFGFDMIAPVPVARWSWEQTAAAATARLPARFGGFLPGAGVTSTLKGEQPTNRAGL